MLAPKVLLSEGEEWSVGETMCDTPLFTCPPASTASEIHWLWQCVFMKLDSWPLQSPKLLKREQYELFKMRR